jgi:cytochrome c biogenesis protein ResB
MVIKRDPGQGVIWLAFVSLIIGLVLTFYFPRRRVWARLDDDRLSVALTTDRYANAAREFDDLLDTLAVRVGRRPQVKARS